MSAIDQNKALHSRAKLFTKFATHLFLSTAQEIRDISVKNTSAEGLSDETGGFISIAGQITGAGIGAAIGGAALPGVGIMAGAKYGSKAGGHLSKLAEKCISGKLKVSINLFISVQAEFGILRYPTFFDAFYIRINLASHF